MAVARKLKDFLQKEDIWLYVDDSQESQEILHGFAPFVEAGVITISDLSGTDRFVDASLPRLLLRGDVMHIERLRRYLQFLQELNNRFLAEEAQC